MDDPALDLVADGPDGGEVLAAGVFSDTSAGIAPASTPAFILMQLVGLIVGVAITLALYPELGEHAHDVVAPHPY